MTGRHSTGRPPTGQPPTGQPPTLQPPTAQPARPVDVDTAFWLWLAAVPLMVIGQLADAYVAAESTKSSYVFVVAALLATVIGGVVVAFLALMRSGYRWTRTLLTAAGIGTILYTAMSLFGAPRPPLPAVVYAVTGIVGSVLIGGGIFLLHRSDSHRFFTR